MKKDLKSIYFDTLDRIYLNSKVKQNSRTLKDQAIKDLLLKKQIETVFESPEKFDVYYQKSTLNLIIEDMPEDRRDKKNLFNRIEVRY